MNKKIWTIEEDDYIRKQFNKESINSIAKHLNVSIKTLQSRAEFLGFAIEHKVYRRWTPEEIELLKTMAPKYLNKTIANKLNRPIEEVNKKARQLNIKLLFRPPTWEDWKIDYLIANINKIPISNIQSKLDVNYYQIMDKLAELNIEYISSNWTQEELTLLIELAPKVYISEITKVINRSPSAIRSKAYKMNIKYITLERTYTDDELTYIKNNWGIIPISEMARQIGVSRTMIQTQADILNLPKLGNNPYRKWTPDKIESLSQLATTKSISALAEIFDTTNEAIITIANRKNIPLLDGKVHWSEEDNEKLIELAKTLDISEIATTMDKSTSAIRLQAERLHIKIIPNKKHSESIWTDQNTEDLKKLAATGKTILEIAITMRKLDTTIAKKAKSNQIEIKPDKPQPWSDDDIIKLIELAKTQKLLDLMCSLAKSTVSIKRIAKKLNITILTDKKSWTTEEFAKLEQLVNDGKTIKEIATALNRSEDAITIKINRSNLKLKTSDKRFWTPEEESSLSDLWGTIPREQIAIQLNRTISSITNKAGLLGLGSYLENNFEGLTFKEISELLNIDISTISVGWISLGLKYKIKNISKTRSYRYVEINDLYNFLRANQNIWDSRNLKKNSLGIEPDWLIEKRKKDKSENPNYDNLKLTKQQLILAKKFFLELQQLKQEQQPDTPKKLKKI